MRTITELKLRKPRQPVFAVELDGEPWEEIDAEVAGHHGLTKGLSLDEAKLREILAASQERRARRQLHRYLQSRLRTRRQIDTYLRRKGLDADQRGRLIDWAEAGGLIDDARYAGAFVRTQKRMRFVGPRRLRSELARDGVSRELADAAVDEHRGRDFRQTITPDEAETLDDAEVQRAECLRLLQKYARRWAREPDTRKRWQKAQRFLMTRGYESGPAVAALRAYWDEARTEAIEPE